MKQENVTHPFLPLYGSKSRILILGSLPSLKSREENFYYGNPMNRFWKVIAAIFNKNPPDSIEEKKTLILKNHLALWDAIYRCDITGSSDQSIRNAEPTNLFPERKSLEIEAKCLPSTSPANASWTFEKLLEEWKIILDCL